MNNDTVDNTYLPVNRLIRLKYFMSGNNCFNCSYYNIRNVYDERILPIHF